MRDDYYIEEISEAIETVSHKKSKAPCLIAQNALLSSLKLFLVLSDPGLSGPGREARPPSWMLSRDCLGCRWLERKSCTGVRQGHFHAARPPTKP